ncbi:MAG: hypothetical protein OXB96_00330 [Candidatus Kaiserbacteria bacterium]|nr:hypothetical protein [Candidatus Kaiserbacteria bacterium]
MKDFYNEWYVIIVVVLVGIGMFMLGGLFVHSLYKPAKATADIHLKPLAVEQQNTNMRRVYASKQGKRYYPWWCDAGNTIAKENKVWYNTPEKAKKEGYTIAKGCQ